MPDSLRGERGVNDEEAGEEFPGAAVEEDGRDGGLARGWRRSRPRQSMVAAASLRRIRSWRWTPEAFRSSGDGDLLGNLQLR